MTDEAKLKRREYNRAYYQANRERLREYRKKWEEAHPEKNREYQSNYWSRKAEEGEAEK